MCETIIKFIFPVLATSLGYTNVIAFPLLEDHRK